MADSISADFSEVHKLVADFGHATARALPLVEAVVKKGAGNVKDEMVADARASRHFRGLGNSISYDSAYGLGSVGYVVGPDKDRRGGALGNIAYFGGAHGGGGTLDIDKPLTSEAPRMIKALEDLTGGLLG